MKNIMTNVNLNNIKEDLFKLKDNGIIRVTVEIYYLDIFIGCDELNDPKSKFVVTCYTKTHDGQINIIDMANDPEFYYYNRYKLKNRLGQKDYDVFSLSEVCELILYLSRLSKLNAFI